ncbi:hypothetical protein DERF_014600 [Dermatophagoides farinae]|uniref:Uncharacterized protein n=1 Tax=Dermatophagoides farinae TaxID=6954 RepID=A0A922L1F7_DERFA|nr:hypothetical protein DERF_014600 [Dermatophagoides farinae]
MSNYSDDPIRKQKLNNFFRHGFEIIKFYNLRINYDLFDYQQRKISWTYSTIKPAIWITLNGWISIVYLSCLIIWPHNDYVMIYGRHFSSMFYRWIAGYSIHFQLFFFDLFECHQINLTQLILSSTMFFSYIIQCIYLISDAFMSISFTVFIMEFFIVRLKQLSSKSALLLQNPRKLFWYKFHFEYVALYSETAKINSTARSILFFIELLSKSAVVICLLFISQQTKMNAQNTIVALAFMSTFSLVNILYFRVAHMPSFNRICWQSIHRWIARSQWLRRQRNKIQNRLPFRYSLKSCLFIQTMTNNLFGFTCGRILWLLISSDVLSLDCCLFNSFSAIFLSISLKYHQINLTQLILSSTLFFSYNIQCIYFIGNAFKSISFTVFIMEFFIVRLKQLSSKSALLLQNSFQSSIRVQKLFWYRFHSEYVSLYSEMAIFNLTARNILFFIELLSKSSVVICLLFISQQTKMNIQITFVALAFMSSFFLLNILYFRVAHMPSYNRICWQSIHRWIARSQWLSMQRNVFTNSFPLRYSIKSRLFIQTMTNNRFGFTCGRMFFISKFKYIQIFLFINDYHNNVSTIRILPNRLQCLYVVTTTWSFHVCCICESNFHILMIYILCGCKR